MRFKTERVEQITLTLENRPGILADLCAHLSDNRINIRALTTLEAADTGAVRLVVDQPDRAADTLADAGVAYSSSECLAIEMPNHPGGFARIARILSAAGINIDFIYASATPKAGVALGIFGVTDLDRALELDWSFHED